MSRRGFYFGDNKFKYFKKVLAKEAIWSYNYKAYRISTLAVKWEVADTLKSVVIAMYRVFPWSKSIQRL
ncbi:MAG: hypothetical protein K2I88_04000 [Anaeroplasmataceae bacterium]|nr:hypothetical protein [Anaeroplasmataceae bacterium]